MKVLINVSNHPSSGWDQSQREGWDLILDVPFPNVKPDLDWEGVYDIARSVFKSIFSLYGEIPKRDSEICILIQGEYTLSYALLNIVTRGTLFDYVAIPTTERMVVEEKDGKKISIFRFVRWRLIPTSFFSLRTSPIL